MVKATIFKNNQSQAVRLPKVVAMPDNVKYVEVIAEGKKRIILPADTAWDDWFEAPPLDEFMDDRLQPEPQEREEF